MPLLSGKTQLVSSKHVYLVNKPISIPWTRIPLPVIPAKAGIQFLISPQTLDPSLRWDDGNIGCVAFRMGHESLRSCLAQGGIILNDFPDRFSSSAVHAVGLTYPRCLMTLDLYQGRAGLIGMYCKDVHNRRPVMSQAACVRTNQLTEASRLAGSRAALVAQAFA